MVSKLPLSDFRAIRQDFAFSEGPDLAPTNLIDENLTHLPDDVAIRTSDHNGHRLKLLQDLWSDWVTAVGDDPRSEIAHKYLGDAELGLGHFDAAIDDYHAAIDLGMHNMWPYALPLSNIGPRLKRSGEALL